MTFRLSFLDSPFLHVILASMNPRLRSLKLLLRLSAQETPLALLLQQGSITYGKCHHEHFISKTVIFIMYTIAVSVTTFFFGRIRQWIGIFTITAISIIRPSLIFSKTAFLIS